MLFLRSQQRKQNHVADRFRPSKQHREPVYPDSKATSWRHTVFKSDQKFLVDVLFFFARLFDQTLTLHKRIIQLAVTWGNLHTVDDQFKNIDERTVFRVLFG